jgi:phosphoheptose isomerase
MSAVTVMPETGCQNGIQHVMVRLVLRYGRLKAFDAMNKVTMKPNSSALTAICYDQEQKNLFHCLLTVKTINFL